jgi:LPS sulfotransferase NodH
MAEERASATGRPVRFVLLSTQRSGSTWVVEMLNSHPQVTCYGALFLPEGRGEQPAGAQMPYFYDLMERDGTSRLALPARSWRFASSVFANTQGGAAVGFKLMYSQFKHVPWVLAYLALHRVRIIHLVRTNKLDHVISAESARARGQFHQRAGEQVANPPVRLDPDRLVDRIRWEEAKVRRAGRILTALRLPVLEIEYEDLVRDPGRYAEILRFLAVDPDVSALTTSLEKWNRRTYEESIENFDEVVTALAGTRYSALFPGG